MFLTLLKSRVLETRSEELEGLDPLLHPLGRKAAWGWGDGGVGVVGSGGGPLVMPGPAVRRRRTPGAFFLGYSWEI